MRDDPGITLRDVKRFLVRAARLARLVHTGSVTMAADEPTALETVMIAAEREARMTRLYLCYVTGTCLRLHFEREWPPGTVLTDERLLTEDAMVRQARDQYQELCAWLPTLEQEVCPGDPGA
jgi:hypothetical protein